MKLPEPLHEGKISVEAALKGRRSVREYRSSPLTLSDVSQLLWATQGVTAAGGMRTAPSAGALYPLEVYLVAGNVEGTAPGVYRYQPGVHSLVQVVSGDRRTELCAAALSQSCVRNAPAIFVLASVYARTTRRYGERGIRYVHMEVGHAAQNLSLQAVARGLGSVCIGAFQDEAVHRVMGMTREEVALYILPVGHP